MNRPSENERAFGLRVTQILDQAPLSDNARSRLAAARHQAVAHAVRLRHRPVLVSRVAGVSQWFSEKWHEHPAAWGASVAFVLAVTVGGWWQLQSSSLKEAEHAVDVQLLADEAPLNTFTDTRFEQWTNTSPTAQD